MANGKNIGQTISPIFPVIIQGKKISKEFHQKKFFVKTGHFVDGKFHGIKCKEAMYLVFEVTEENYKSLNEGDEINLYDFATSAIKDMHGILYESVEEVPKGTIKKPKWKIGKLLYISAIPGEICESAIYFQDIKYAMEALERCLWPMSSAGWKLYKRTKGKYKLIEQYKRTPWWANTVRQNKMQKARRFFRNMEITLWTGTVISIVEALLLIKECGLPAIGLLVSVLSVMTGYEAYNLAVMRIKMNRRRNRNVK